MAIRVSKRTHYALRAVFELAGRGTAAPIAVADVAQAQDIPPRFLEGILNELRHAGLVASQRGNAGGYSLALSPEQITVADILEATQGPISVVAGECRNGQSKYVPGDSAFDELWQTVDESIAEVCRRTTIADLMKWERMNERTPVPDYVI